MSENATSDTKLRQFAVFGHPVAHSLSPRIHQAFAKQLGLLIEYRAIDVAPAALPAALDAFATAGGMGANITLPHKETAFALCAARSDRAARSGSVNTLTRVNGRWHGDNTDGAGLVRDLTERQRFDLRGRRTLLLGAGGAARGVAPALLDAGIDELVIVNRSPERADALADVLGDPQRAHSRYWKDLGTIGEFDLLINATSAGRAGGRLDLPFALIAPRALAVDLNYGEIAVPFLAWAESGGCKKRSDGLGMLVEQAAESFAIWTGKRPSTEAIFDELSQQAQTLHTAD
jgi:shikimate dehydrogenase